MAATLFEAFLWTRLGYLHNYYMGCSSVLFGLALDCTPELKIAIDLTAHLN